MTAAQKFELAMQAERDYAALEYSAVKYREFSEADKCHAMRWRMLDKAAQFAFEANQEEAALLSAEGKGGGQ